MATPIGYTTHYSFRQWALGTNNIATELNDTLEEIDAAIYNASQSGGSVTSVFSRTGNVVAAVGDYDASQIDNDSSVSGATVKDALETLESAIGYTFNYPLSESSKAVSLLYTSNFQLNASNQLEPKPINLTGAYGMWFEDGQGNSISTINLGQTLELGTPQDLRATASPRFNNQYLSGNLQLDGGGNIVFYTPGEIGTDNFYSRTTGWNVDYEGNADFRNLFATEMHVQTFVVDMEQALAGSQIISKSVAIIAEDFALPSVGSTGTLKVNSFDGYDTMAVFEVNDYIRLRQMSRMGGGLVVADAWVKVNSFDGNTGNVQSFTVERISGGSATGTISAGTLALDYGVSGDGYLEAVAYGSNTPYYQAVEWSGATPVGNSTVKARIGDLGGATFNGNSLSGNGLVSENAYLSGELWALSGGFGGTLGSPAIKLTSDGMYIKSRTNAATTLDGVYIGNYSAASGFDGAILNQSGLYGYKSGNQVMRVDTSGALLGGFTLDYYKLTCPGMEITAKNTTAGSNAGVKVMNTGSWWNRVEMYYVNDSDFGMFAKDINDNYLFQLGTTNQIAGWSFDKEKFLKDPVRIESSASLKGLAVKKTINTIDYDIIKFGDFSETPSDISIDDTSSLIGTYGTFESSTDFSAWVQSPSSSYERTSASAHSGFYSARLKPSTSSMLLDASFHLDFSVSNMDGETFDISGWFKRGTSFVGNDMEDFTFQIEANDGSGFKIIAQKTYDVINTFSTSSWSQRAIRVTVPDNATQLRIYFRLQRSSSGALNDFFFDDIEIKRYPYIRTFANIDGLHIANSPNNYLKFTTEGFELGVHSIKSEGYNVTRWLGKISAYASWNLKEGDLWEDSSGNVWIKTSTGNKQLA